MHSHLRAAVASGSAAAGTVAAGVVRVKLCAVFLGAAGMGVLAQVQNVFGVLAALAALGMGVGITRQVAGAGGTEEIRRTVATARGLTAGVALSLAAALALGSGPLAALLLGDRSHARWLMVAALGLVFHCLSRVDAEVLNGLGLYRLHAESVFWQAGLTVALLPPLLLSLGLAGAVIALPATALSGWTARHLLLRRARPGLRGAGLRPDAGCARGLLAIGAATLVAAVADEAVLLLVRARLIQLHGVEANGLFQGAWGLSQQLLNVGTVFVIGYPVARIHAAGDRQELLGESNKTLRVTLLMMTPPVAAMILLRGPLVRLFLAPEFGGAIPLFPHQALGVLLRVTGLALGIGLLAVAPLRAWAALGLIAAASFLGGFLLLSPRLGLQAAPAAYALSGAAYLVAAAGGFRHYARGRLEPSALRLMLASALLMGGILALDGITWAGIGAGWYLLPGWILAGLRPADLREARRMLAPGGRDGE